MADFISCALRELRRSRKRTFYSLSGYVIFISMLLLILNVLLYAKVKQDAIIGTTGTHFVTWLPACGDITSLTEEELAKLAKGIIPEKCSKNCANCTGCNKKPRDIYNEGFVVNTNATRLVSFEVVDKIRSLPTVKDASPCLMFRYKDPKTGFLFSVAGIFPNSLAAITNTLDPKEVVEGKPLDESVSGKIIVDEGYALNYGLKIGSKVMVSEEEFEIIGISRAGQDPVRPDFYMLFKDNERCLNKRIFNPLDKEANIILVESYDGNVHSKSMEDTKKIMQGDSLMTSGCYYPASKALGLNNKLIAAFIIILLFSSCAAAVKIQFSAVTARKKDIAVLKAIGWTDSVVLKQLAAESLIVSFLGCVIGCALGFLLLYGLPLESMLDINIEPMGSKSLIFVILVLLFALVSGGAAGVIPVFAALRERPAQLLRR